MLPEIGNLALIIVWVIAISMMLLPFLKINHHGALILQLQKSFSIGQLTMIGIAYGILTYAFITHDFSIAYVASHSNQELPIFYRIAAVWGSHEGSLLLWILLLSLWTFAVAILSKKLPTPFLIYTLGVLSLINVGFTSFTLFTSNPFERLFPPALDGLDLNPLLQDPGLVIHPPMLYIGYVGLSVCYAFAVASLLAKKIDNSWINWLRPWTLTAWIFLTCGITLGSWWAYNELGWGGWWFWDPVENASFMPWLLATALLHSQFVAAKRGILLGWTLLLAITTFSLSILGTFLVRSGVLVSVHAFANDPDRGTFILIFLGIIIGLALLLYGINVNKLRQSKPFKLLSKETLLLSNNVFLCCAVAMILLGTMYPLLLDLMGAEKISVGPPYFNLMFIYIMLPAILLMAITPWINWQSHQVNDFYKTSIKMLLFTIILSAIIYLVIDIIHFSVLIGIATFIWLATGTVIYFVKRLRLAKKLSQLTPTVYGTTLAHFGVALFALSVSISENYSINKDVAMTIGDNVNFAGFNFLLSDIKVIQGPNFDADEVTIELANEARTTMNQLTPQKRRYSDSSQVMTEADIDIGLFRDIYIALGDQLEPNLWAMRLYYRPMTRWIWISAILMALGGLINLVSSRKRNT